MRRGKAFRGMGVKGKGGREGGMDSAGLLISASFVKPHKYLCYTVAA